MRNTADFSDEPDPAAKLKFAVLLGSYVEALEEKIDARGVR